MYRHDAVPPAIDSLATCEVNFVQYLSLGSKRMCHGEKFSPSIPSRRYNFFDNLVSDNLEFDSNAIPSTEIKHLSIEHFFP